MLRRCLQRLMPSISTNVARNDGLLVSTTRHAFSVVNYRTFGYFLNNQKDPIMMQIASLNKLFAQNLQNTQFQKINSFIQVVNKTLKFQQIPFEKQSQRQFNIFEVVAYCLFQQLQKKPVFQNKNQYKKQYIVLRDQFFKQFQNYLMSLKTIEKQLLTKISSFQQWSAFQIQYILKCSIMFFKKQIFRRFYQMCHFIEDQKPIHKNIKQFSQRLADEYGQVAGQMIGGFSRRLDNSNEFLQIGKELKQKGEIHHFVIDQIMSMFSDDIQNGYYTPLFNLQNRYKMSSQFQQIEKKDKFQLKNSIHTISFIPTYVTYKLHYHINTLDLRNFFVSGIRYMGKSMSYLMITILRGYIYKHQFILVPKCTIDGIAKSIYPCILQSLWKQLPKKKFIQIEKLSRKLFQKLNQDDSQNGTHTVDRYLSEIISIFRAINPYIKGVILDQFSTFVKTCYNDSKQIKNSKSTDDQLFKFYIKIFNQVYDELGNYVVCCSSIAYEQNIIGQYLIAMQQDINKLNITQEFQKKQASHLLIIWLNRCLKTHQFKKNIIFHRQKKQQQKKALRRATKNEDNQNSSEEKLNHQSDNHFNTAQFRRIKQQIDSFSKQIKNDSKLLNIFGQMSVIKQCAQQLIQFLLQNIQNKLTPEQVNKRILICRVNHYQKLIKKWLKPTQNIKNQLQQRKKIIHYLLNKIPLAKIFLLFSSEVMPQIPKFLLNFNLLQKINDQKYMNLLSHQVQPISNQIWQKVKSICFSGQLSEFNRELYQKYRNKSFASIGTWCGAQFQICMRQVIKYETINQYTPFLNKICQLYFKEEELKFKIFKKINIQNTALYPLITIERISEQLDKQFKLAQQQQNIIINFSVHHRMPGCDRFLIKITNSKQGQVKKRMASIIHIEQGINKNQQDLNKLFAKVYFNLKLFCLKQERIDLENQLKKQISDDLVDSKIKQLQKNTLGYKNRFIIQLAKKNITLNSYKIAIVTGHKASYLKVDEKEFKVINPKKFQEMNVDEKQFKDMIPKIINFNDLNPSQNNIAHFKTQLILAFYAYSNFKKQIMGRNKLAEKELQYQFNKFAQQQKNAQNKRLIESLIQTNTKDTKNV